MQEKRGNRMMKLIKLFTITYFALFICGCSSSKNNIVQVYSLQYTNDSALTNHVDYKLIRTTSVDKDLNYVCERCIKNKEESEKCSYYKCFSNAVFAIKIIYDFDKTPMDTLLVLNYFTEKDTSFHYFYDVQKYPPTKPFGTDDYFYSIAKIRNNLYVFYKENYIDSTFSELQFYDDDFAVIKIIKFAGNKFYEFIDDKYIECPGMKNSFMEEYFEKVKRISLNYKHKTIEIHE
jgi:hypothetical protein